jgi:PAS domain S-box-containing protein
MMGATSFGMVGILNFTILKFEKYFMSYHYSPYIVPLILAALISGWVMVYAWSRRSAPNAVALALMAFSITEWLLGYALEIAGADLATKLFWGKSQYIGITLAPMAWVVFAYYHVNQGKRPTPRKMMPLAIIPIITVLLAFTTEFHGLVWKTIDIQQSGTFSALALSYGPWFWVWSAYSYLLLLTGTVIILRSLGRIQGLYRGQTAALIIALVAPWLGNILYLAKLSPIPNLDLTPFAFAITVSGLAWAIFGYQLVNISPIARDLIVDGMVDGMIALDMRGKIADINLAAGRIIGVPISQAIGKSLADVLSPWPHIVERFREVVEASDEIVVGEGEARRQYAIHISPLSDQKSHALGRLITIRDVNAGFIPQPRFAVRDTQADSLPETESRPAPVPGQPVSILGRFVEFIQTPLKTDIPIPANVNPKWYQARERSFTLILRVAALLGTITLVIAPSFTKLAAGGPFAIIILFFWFLGLARKVSFNVRTIAFLILVYVMAFVETYNFGFSAASFTFFMTLVVSATLLMGRKTGLVALLIAATTLGSFGLLIGGGTYVPINAHEGIPVPRTIQRALTSLLAFSASAAGLVVSVTILMESLNKAWQLETQALNLLQQERDLLEQRVTERTRDLAQAHDEAIKNNNELHKYFMAIEQSGNTIVITDTAGSIEYANPKFFELTGYAADEASGQNPRILQSGEHSPAFYTDMWDTIRAGKIWHGEFHNRRKDGSLFWESATIAPVQNHLGEITNFLAIKEDITAQKELQAKLHQQNEQMTQEIAERMHVQAQNEAFLKDIKALQEIHIQLSQIETPSELYIKMVELAQKRLGFDRVGLFLLNEATGELHGTYGVGQDGQVRDERLYREAITPGHWTYEIEKAHNRVRISENEPIYDAHREIGRGSKADTALWNGYKVIGYLVSDNFVSHGSLRPYEAELISLLGNTFGHLIEQQRAETRLQESEARFRQIVENASDIIYRANMEGHFTYVNPVGVRIMGFKDESDILGRHFLELTSPTVRHKLKRFYDHQFLSGTSNTYNEVPVSTADGREIWLGQNVQTIKDGNQTIGFQAVARDITQIKQTQAALAVARDQALEANRLKTQFLAKVSHELRTPLGSVMGYAELLQEGLYGPLEAEPQDIVGRIVESAHYLTEMVNELLDEAQLETKNMTLRLDFCSPTSLLQKIEARMAVLAKNKGLSFATELIAPFPERLYADEQRLQQILVNLTGNAIKFTKTGAVHIRMYQNEPGHWHIQVSDTGAGIPDEAQKYIFEPFRQVNNAITNENRGTGLGLAIVKQLVDLMGGEIRLESAVGQGSLFTITLPIIKKQAEASNN